MKLITRIFAVLVLLAVFAFPTTVLAANLSTVIPGDKVVFGGTFTLKSGDTLEGNLAVFGGTATIENSAKVNGDVLLAGGTLDINGEVAKNVSAMGGSLFLGDNAVVHGDIAMLGATLHRAANAVVDGRTINGLEGPLNVVVPGTVTPPGLTMNLKPITEFFWFIFRTLAIAALAMLLALFIPQPIQRASRAITTEPIATGGIGLLTVIIAPILILLLTITIILIPVSLLVILLLIAAWVFGWIAVGTEVGNRLAQVFKSTWALPVAAGIGTLITSLVLGVIGYIPCIGWIPGALVGLFGLGAVLLTRFGVTPYPQQVKPYYSPMPYPSQPPSGVVPVVPSEPPAPSRPYTPPEPPMPPSAPDAPVPPTPPEPLIPPDESNL